MLQVLHGIAIKEENFTDPQFQQQEQLSASATPFTRDRPLTRARILGPCEQVGDRAWAVTATARGGELFRDEAAPHGKSGGLGAVVNSELCIDDP